MHVVQNNFQGFPHAAGHIVGDLDHLIHHGGGLFLGGFLFSLHRSICFSGFLGCRCFRLLFCRCFSSFIRNFLFSGRSFPVYRFFGLPGILGRGLVLSGRLGVLVCSFFGVVRLFGGFVRGLLGVGFLYGFFRFGFLCSFFGLFRFSGIFRRSFLFSGKCFFRLLFLGRLFRLCFGFLGLFLGNRFRFRFRLLGGGLFRSLFHRLFFLGFLFHRGHFGFANGSFGRGRGILFLVLAFSTFNDDLVIPVRVFLAFVLHGHTAVLIGNDLNICALIAQVVGARKCRGRNGRHNRHDGCSRKYPQTKRIFLLHGVSPPWGRTPAPGSRAPACKKGPPLRATEAAPPCEPKPLPHRQPLACGAFFVQLAAMLQAL